LIYSGDEELEDRNNLRGKEGTTPEEETLDGEHTDLLYRWTG
jgi:hypothetical protein